MEKNAGYLGHLPCLETCLDMRTPANAAHFRGSPYPLVPFIASSSCAQWGSGASADTRWHAGAVQRVENVSRCVSQRCLMRSPSAASLLWSFGVHPASVSSSPPASVIEENDSVFIYNCSTRSCFKCALSHSLCPLDAFFRKRAT
jgi:hypothetical protein